MSVGTVRIYDLARDLKQDTKRVIEDLRREGADVSVPSNSVSKELADKVRSKYFPKVDTAPKRTIKIIKKKTIDESSEFADDGLPEINSSDVSPELEDESQTLPPQHVSPPIVEEQETSVKKVRKLQKKVEEVIPDEIIQEKVEVQPKVETESPSQEQAKVETIEEKAVEPVVIAEPLKVETPPVRGTVLKELRLKEVEPEKTKEVLTSPKIFRPTGTQVKQLTLTKEAREAGIKPGEKVISEAPTKTGKLQTDKKEKPKRESRRERT